MKVSLWKSLGFALCLGLTLAASAIAAEDAEAVQDDVANRTERALFKMSQVQTGKKRVRIVTPAKPVSAQAPLVDPPVEMQEVPPAAPMPESEMTDDATSAAPFHDPTLLSENCDTCGECGDCNSCCCDCLCGPPGNCWVRAEVLGWWTKGMNTPPLITAGTSQAQPGVIGQPGTQILFGGEDVNNKARIGGRISAGTWLDDCHIWGLEGDYFGLDDSDQAFYATGHDYPFLSRPFVDVTNGLPGSNAVEGVNNEDLCGDILARTKSGFQGAGAALRRNLCCHTACGDCSGHNPNNWSDWSACCCRLDFLAGFRFYRLDDSVYINERLMSIADQGPVAFGTTYNIFDDFRTRNEFYGGEFGLIGTTYRGRWSLEGLVKVALGNNHSTVRINGQTTTTVPGQAPNTLEGGLLALPSNIGTYSRNDFAVIPQFGVKVGYQCNCHVRLLVGYDFLYWANVSRAGDQIDTRVDTNQLPPGTAGNYPEFRYRDETFWAQGISGGVEVRW
jgi:hypothetical protein